MLRGSGVDDSDLLHALVGTAAVAFRGTDPVLGAAWVSAVADTPRCGMCAGMMDECQVATLRAELRDLRLAVCERGAACEALDVAAAVLLGRA